MFARILILVLMMGCCGTAFSQKRIPVEINCGFYNLKPIQVMNVDISLSNRTQKLLSVNLKLANEATHKSFIDSIPIEANSELTYEISFMILNDSNYSPQRREYNFTLSGEEIKLNFYNNFEYEYKIPSIASTGLTKSYDGSEMAELIPDWDFKIGSLPQYKIINKQEKLLYGSGYLNSFWSDYYYINKGKWETNPPLGICGTIGRQLPIEKGDTAYATLPTYIGIYEMAIKQPGEYIFTTEFSDSPLSEFVKPKDSNTLFTIKSYYLISIEFEIK